MIYFKMYLKKSSRSPSSLAFNMLPIPPTCANPIIITANTENVVKTL